MPEGPEVETIRVGLLPIVGKRITKVRVADHKKYRPHADEIYALQGYVITAIERRGKFLIFSFEKPGQKLSGLNHLGMTGVWFLYSTEEWQKFDDPFAEYEHFKVYLELEKEFHLLFVNIRTFGRFEVYTPEEIEEHPAIKRLGPDILADNFDTEGFIQRMRGKGSRKRTKEVGKCLLDYTIIAGCGNIYKNEALFMSDIHPMTPANELSDEQLVKLGKNLSIVAKKAFKFKGSTLQDYKHVDGYSGLMQNEFQVYDREGDPCYECGSQIIREVQGDRASFWCPNCQDNDWK